MSGLPPLVEYPEQDSYRAHFERVYCVEPLVTFDGVRVRFRKGKFWHAFFESPERNQVKSRFSFERARRVDWIKAALEDSAAELYVGWDRERKRYDGSRRVAVVSECYVVVIALKASDEAEFVTAFPANDRTLRQIRSSPEWSGKGKPPIR